MGVLDLGIIAFANPLLLAALALLPLLWLLLRVTPPAPRRLFFPAISMLLGLKAQEETPNKTPWWLVLLRAVATALVILGLAQPVLNPDRNFSGSGPLILIVDDGWSSARFWSHRLAAAERLTAQAAREDRDVFVVTTAKQARGDAPLIPVPANEAQKALRSLEPKPWPLDRPGALERFKANFDGSSAHVVWLSDGLLGSETEESLQAFARELQNFGQLDILEDLPGASARLLLPPDSRDLALVPRVERASGEGEEGLNILSIGPDGEIIAKTPVFFEAGAKVAEGEIDLPAELRNRIEQLRIDEEKGAGAVLLLDERWRRRPVGVVEEFSEALSQPLLSGAYFLERALAPYTELRRGTQEELLQRELAVIITTDDSELSDLSALQDWTENGGLLLRFSGPRLAQDPSGLLPVELRGRDRVLGGALTWNEPEKLAPFPDESPFQGLEVPADVLVNRQVLAEPSLDLARKTWASLADGTPLVTAERQGEGWVVLFHISANTDWSNLPLSGLFVDMIRRLLQVSEGVVSQDSATELAPLSTLDGYGVLTSPGPKASNITAEQIQEEGSIGPLAPPGYYGEGSLRRAHNLGGDIAALSPLPAPSVGVTLSSYGESREFPFGPWLITLALLLLLSDFVISLILRGHFTGAKGMATQTGLIALICLVGFAASGIEAQAQTNEARALEATSATRLGFVLTDVPEVDATSAAGLSGLTRILHLRTSIEAAPPLPIDIEQDELAFFPLIYWPILRDHEGPSAKAKEKLQNYMANGGTVLFDLRDPTAGARITGQTSQAEESLQRVLTGVEIPPLVPIPPDHVLTKSFYLMQDFPGRFAGGTLWVEGAEAKDRDGVSSIVIGSNDWASAWAVDRLSRPLNPVVPGGERQREMAYRFGVNLVMYALTGNYKADQVHVPFILERLGQ